MARNYLKRLSIVCQHYKQIEIDYLRGLNFKDYGISILQSINEILNNNHSLREELATLTDEYFESQGIIANLTSHHSAIYGTLLSDTAVVYIYSEERGTYTQEIHTSSQEVLDAIAKSPQFYAEKGLPQDIYDKCSKVIDISSSNSRLKKSFTEDTVQTIRLTYKLIDGKIRCMFTVPRSRINTKTDIIVPMGTFQAAEKVLDNFFASGIINVTTCDGETKTVTKNVDILHTVYSASRVTQLLSIFNDYRLKNMYVPELGASIYTSGLFNIKMHLIDMLDYVGSIASVDLSRINVSADGLNLWLSRVLTEDKCDWNALSPLLGCETPTFENVKASLLSMYDKGTYSFIQENKTLFSRDIVDGTGIQHIGTIYEPYLDSINSKSDLESLLKTGIFKILIGKVDGTHSTLYVTRNHDELTKVYGSDVWEKLYTSRGTRCRALQKHIKALDQGTVFDLPVLKMLVADTYGLEDLYFKCADIAVNGKVLREVLLSEISDLFEDIKDSTTVVKQSHLALGYSCDSYVIGNNLYSTELEIIRRGFYKNIDFRNIRSIVRLSRADSSKEEEIITGDGGIYTIDTVIKVPSGNIFNLSKDWIPNPKLDPRIKKYLESVAIAQRSNCNNFVVVDKEGSLVDNEHDLEEIYKYFENEDV